MKRRLFVQSCTVGAMTLLPKDAQLVRPAETTLDEAFRRPPASARAKTWWHWENGNITADGITRDLEAMQRAGIGGVQMFQDGQMPKGPVAYGSPEHLRLIQHAIREAERLGLEFDMHNCPGFSASGGPWITPELSMQELVWTETNVRGGQTGGITLKRPHGKRNYYRDAFVLAFPSLAGESRASEALLRSVTTNSGPVDGGLLTDGDLAGGVELRPAAAGQSAYLQFEYAELFEARSVTLYSSPAGAPMSPAALFGGGGSALSLQASQDGIEFRKICEVDPGVGGAGGPRGSTADVPRAARFAAVRAKYFRLVCPQPRRIHEFRLSGADRVADWPRKSNFGDAVIVSFFPAEPLSATGEVPRDSVIDPASVVNLTPLMDREGRLSWQAPAGDWTILRLGHTTTGTPNHPAPDGGGGLECDKYSRAAMDFHFDQYFGKLFTALRPLADKGMAGALIDSYEVGYQNWTAEFPQGFQQRRGYDLTKYLPAMTGRVVGSGEISDRFLWDVRRTQADLMSDYYYGRLTELCHRHGMKSYAEPYSGGPLDQLQAGSRLDVPMGEFWVGQFAYDTTGTIKLAASVAHVNGRGVVGAESYTGMPSFSKWLEYPYAMKAQGDYMFTLGVNRFIFHRYAMQPHPDAAPGMTMGRYGSHIERTNTWFGHAKPWLEYVSRCQHMLQQGLFVADVAYFTGEDVPAAPPGLRSMAPPLPPGHDFDFISAEPLLTKVKVDNGRIVLPDGLSYRVLVLEEKTTMTAELLRKIHDLVQQGMCVAGPKPQRPPSLTRVSRK